MLSLLDQPLDRFPLRLAITPIAPAGQTLHPFNISIRPPGSKSLTNRALLLASLARGTSFIRKPLIQAQDAQRMITAVTALGASIETIEPASGTSLEPDLRITGVNGAWKQGAMLNLGNAGTATRFLAAASLLSQFPIVIDGDQRMRERPIAELVQALRQAGGDVEYLAGGKPGCPPIQVRSHGEPIRSIRLDIPQTQSSQFISALLLLGPFLQGGVTLRLTGHITSPSYIEMTLNLLEQLGAHLRTSEDMRVLRVGPVNSVDPHLPAFEYATEADASGATYFWAAAALVPGARCAIDGVPIRSSQGDAGFAKLLEQCGSEVLVGGDRYTVRGNDDDIAALHVDMARMPDAVMTLAAVASFARRPSIIRGIRTLRVKETDRVAALTSELAKIGVVIESPVDGDLDVMRLTPPANGVDCSRSAAPVEFETYDDHRMAMAMALIGLRRPNVWINNPACVAKTYPTFWSDWAKLYQA